jgi:hypothetical protein
MALEGELGITAGHETTAEFVERTIDQLEGPQ